LSGNKKVQQHTRKKRSTDQLSKCFGLKVVLISCVSLTCDISPVFTLLSS